MTFLMTFLLIACLVLGLGYALDYWILPWRSQRTFDRFLRDLKSGKPSPPRDHHFEILSDASGFEVIPLKKSVDKPLESPGTP
jgi:hypothetical protein